MGHIVRAGGQLVTGDCSDIMWELLVTEEFGLLLSYLCVFMTDDYFKILNCNYTIIISSFKKIIELLNNRY